MQVFERVIEDRGSRYAVSGGACQSASDAEQFVKRLIAHKKRFAKATHHSWALLVGDDVIKRDDGETGAGAVIARALQQANLTEHIVVVSRWYGGKHLGCDRFRHVAHAARFYLDQLASPH